jgi:putative endonuclease
MIEFTEGYHIYYVYIITNKYRTTFYTGMTNNLPLRLQQHSENIVNGSNTFVSRYNIAFLVYFEKFT